MSTQTSDYPITITPAPGRVRVVAGGQVVADSTHALSLKEASYPPVLYIPREDVRLDLMTRTDHHSHCPYKGDASYFSVNAPDRTRNNAAWTYETPLPGVAAIAGHLAFYPDRIDAIEQG
jgi:uncharacterized protein (DUF427 family)